jgi:hypothetical protein
MQGRRKLRKVGGARLRGALFGKKGHLKIIFGDLPPPIFFPEIKTFFRK